MRAYGERRSDQHAVWEEISAKASSLNAHSRTSAMFDIYETHMKRIDEYAGAFTASDRQVGAAFAINGEVIGFDLFDSPATFKKLLPKLVRSYALDAIESAEKKSASGLSAISVKELLLSVTKAEAKTFPAVGEGMDVRITAPNVMAAGLVAKGRVVHLSGFALQ
jgi:hypothetical protein